MWQLSSEEGTHFLSTVCSQESQRPWLLHPFLCCRLQGRPLNTNKSTQYSFHFQAHGKASARGPSRPALFFSERFPVSRSSRTGLTQLLLLWPILTSVLDSLPSFLNCPAAMCVSMTNCFSIAGQSQDETPSTSDSSGWGCFYSSSE